MSTLLEKPITAPARPPGASPRITVHGDFNCPWSYLAFRRAAVLEATGLHVDWRAVEHAPWTPRRHDDLAARFAELRGEMGAVLDMLLPGERLPYDLAGFVPHTRASVAAYAEAYAAGVPALTRRVIFESFWMHGIDIGDPRVLRILIVDELRSGVSESEVVRDWGYPVDITGGPVSSDGWRLVREWSRQWHEARKQVVPVLRVADQEPIFGVDAVEWLGRAIETRGLESELPPDPLSLPPPSSARDLPALGWASESGGRWLRRHQYLPASPYLRQA